VPGRSWAERRASITGTISVSMKKLVVRSKSAGDTSLILSLRSPAYCSIERRKVLSAVAFSARNSMRCSGIRIGMGGSASLVHSMAKYGGEDLRIVIRRVLVEARDRQVVRQVVDE